MLSTFSREAALKEDTTRSLNNPTFNVAVESNDKSDKDRGIAGYTSTIRLLMSYMEKKKIRVRFARELAASDMRVEIIGAIMALNFAGSEELYLPVTGRQYLLTGCDCPDQTGHNDLEVRRGRSSLFFVLLFESEATFILVYPAVTMNLKYPTAEKKKLPELLNLKEVAIPACHFLVGYWYQQHGRRDRRGSYCP